MNGTIDPTLPPDRATDIPGDVIESSEPVKEVPSVLQPSVDDAPAVERITALVDAGSIGQAEAVNRILDEVLLMQMLGAAPAGVREDLSEAIGALLKTDPHLQSLASALKR